MITTAALLLTVMTFNVQWAGAQAGTPNAWTNGRRAIAAQTILSADPDVIGVQEPTVPQLADMDADLSGYARVGTRNAIYVRRGMFRVLAQGEFWLSTTPGVPSVAWSWGAIRERTCRYAWLEHLATGERVWVLNAHVSNRSPVAQLNSVALIDALARELRPVLVGDLNCQPGSAAARYLLGRGWQDALAVVSPRGTYHDYDRLTASGPSIDWVLAWGRPVTAGYVHRFRSAAGRAGSDHEAVVASVALR